MLLLVLGFSWRISSASGAAAWGISQWIVLSSPLLIIEGVEVVVEVEGVGVEVMVLEPSWPQLQPVEVCKVLFFTMVYRVEFFLEQLFRDETKFSKPKVLRTPISTILA